MALELRCSWPSVPVRGLGKLNGVSHEQRKKCASWFFSSGVFPGFSHYLTKMDPIGFAQVQGMA
jgi:hypothetical protein